MRVIVSTVWSHLILRVCLVVLLLSDVMHSGPRRTSRSRKVIVSAVSSVSQGQCVVVLLLADVMQHSDT